MLSAAQLDRIVALLCSGPAGTHQAAELCRSLGAPALWLRGARLRRASLSDLDLRAADLRRADLSGARLTGALLIGALTREADLRGADLCGAVVMTPLDEANLSGARYDTETRWPPHFDPGDAGAVRKQA